MKEYFKKRVNEQINLIDSEKMSVTINRNKISFVIKECKLSPNIYIMILYKK
jgi:hypothetical protein